MSEEEEEFIEGISEAYRFRTVTQVSLLALSIIAAVIVLEFIPVLDVELRFTLVVVVAAVAFPVFIKDRNRLTRSVSLGLFLAAVALISWYALPLALPLWPISQTSALLLASMIAISVQLFEFLLPHVLKRNKPGYLSVVVIGVAFSGLTSIAFNFLPPFGPFTIWSIVFFVIVFMVFSYAILPEKPV
ncbi:MAG: hypothetical protein ACTSVM_05690 [Candidatus Ranarchaeia archaeon]